MTPPPETGGESDDGGGDGAGQARADDDAHDGDGARFTGASRRLNVQLGAVGRVAGENFGAATFVRLSADQQDQVLTALEKQRSPFFSLLIEHTMEGFYGDPRHGGNRDRVGWKMIGFPGLPANYREEIKTYFNKKYDKAPQSIADFS